MTDFAALNATLDKLTTAAAFAEFCENFIPVARAEGVHTVILYVMPADEFFDQQIAGVDFQDADGNTLDASNGAEQSEAWMYDGGGRGLLNGILDAPELHATSSARVGGFLPVTIDLDKVDATEATNNLQRLLYVAGHAIFAGA
jgi:hypothetical protein